MKVDEDVERKHREELRADGVEVDVKSWRDKSRRDGGAERRTDTDKDTKKNTQAAKTTNALRVPGALGAAAQTYARCMDKAPLATKAATSAAIFGASDACAQKLERVKEPDATRLLTTTAIGGLYFAPAVLRSAWENASTASRWRRRDAVEATQKTHKKTRRRTSGTRRSRN